MTSSRARDIARWIRRVLHWLACLIIRETARAQMQHTGSHGPGLLTGREDVIPPINTTTMREARETSAQIEPEIGSRGETGSARQLPSRPPADPSSDQHEKTLDQTATAPEGSELEAPEATTPEKPNSKRGRDKGPSRPEEQAEERQRSVVPPEERGGRPRRGSAGKEHGKRRSERPAPPRAEIVCWKREREWVVGVEIIPDDPSISVFQDDVPLSPDRSRDGWWPLAKLDTAARVHVVVSSHNRTINILLPNYWLFKLTGKKDEGRMVKHASSGSYLAIVPETWQRDEEKAGAPRTTPEPTFLKQYLAHFFELTESASSRIAFRNQLGQSIVIDSSGPQFHLVGHEIHDNTERMGPLFGGTPPRLEIKNGDWSDVKRIVLGEEGSGRHRWRTSFEPEPDRTQQELPHEVLERKAGWYFLRFYDSTDTLIDSLDFRFVAGLKELSIPEARPVPSPDGHLAQTVEIHHDAGYRVRPQPGQKCPGLKIEQDTDKTVVTIPPTAECDSTRWYIGPANSDDKKVEFTILIERLWWALSSDDKEPSRWEDRPVPLSLQHFAATSDRAIWLRFPKPRQVPKPREVSAGFRPESSRRFPVKVADYVVSIPLREFAGVRELEDKADDQKFKVWAKITEDSLEDPTEDPPEATVGILPADAQVTPLVGDAGDLKVTLAHLEQLANWLLEVQQPVDITALVIKYTDILKEEAGLESL